jgi:hypothetical protein
MSSGASTIEQGDHAIETRTVAHRPDNPQWHAHREPEDQCQNAEPHGDGQLRGDDLAHRLSERLTEAWAKVAAHRVCNVFHKLDHERFIQPITRFDGFPQVVRERFTIRTIERPAGDQPHQRKRRKSDQEQDGQRRQYAPE